MSNLSVAKRKSDAEYGWLVIKVRVTQEHREMFKEAAHRAGLTVSSWIRFQCVAAARLSAVSIDRAESMDRIREAG